MMKGQIQAALILVLFLMGLAPNQVEAADDGRGLQDAFLLLSASHHVLELGEVEVREVFGKFASPEEAANHFADDTLSGNEITALRQAWGEACSINLARLKAHFTGQQECELVAMMEAACAKQMNWLDEQSEELERARRRRARNRGLQGVFRRIGRGIRNADPQQAVRWFGREVVKEVAKSAITGGVEIKRKAIIALGRQIFQKKLKQEIAYAVQRNQMRRQIAAVESNSANTILTSAAKQFELSSAEIQAIRERCSESGPQAQESGECGTDGAWIDAYWENVVATRLKEDFKHCSNTNPYRHCLEQQAAAGLCEEAAHNACKEIYASLWSIPPGPISLGRANVTTPMKIIWESFEFEMTFDGRGGPVTGNHESVRVFNADTDPCTTTINLEFSGSFSPSTCLMEGNATRKLSLSQPGIAGPCWSHGCNFGPEGCTEPDPWAMKVYDGRLNCVPDVGRYSVCSLEIELNP